MAEKSDGESEDILEQIRLLEKQKSELERKRKEKDEAEHRNRDRLHLQNKLKQLRGEVGALQDVGQGGSRGGYGDNDGAGNVDLSALRQSQERIQLLQSRLTERSPTRSRRSRDDHSETSEEEVDDVMSNRHKQMIQLNRDILVENMICDDIFNDLIANKILSTADVSRIKEKNIREAINEELLNNLVRKSDRAFHVFVRSLRKTLQEYLANRLDPSSSSRKKKRKRQAGEMNVNVDCEEITPVSRNQQTCSCQDVEEQILIMAKTAYRNIRRRNDTPAAFEQFRKELRETNTVIKDSMEIMNTLKILCRHGDLMNVSNGSIIFTYTYSSVLGLKDLWEKYKSGELLRLFQKTFVTRTLRRKCRAKSIQLRVSIAEDEYAQCLRELESQAGCTLFCTPPKKRNLPSIKQTTLRPRSRRFSENFHNSRSENFPSQIITIPHESSNRQTRPLASLHINQVLGKSELTKSAARSPRIPFYDLRNRQLHNLSS